MSSTRSRTRRAESGRRRPPSTSPPASPAAGSQTLLVDLDPQCNATVALGGDRDMQPSSYDCLTADVSVAEAARPAGPDNLWLVPASRDLAGASVELPRIEGSETRLRERLGPVRERFAVHRPRLPALARPGQRQRAGRRRPGDRPGPGRVPGARGARPVPRHAGDDPPRDEPGARRVGPADHHARRAHPPRPGRRARAARALPRDGLRDGDPAQRPRRRGAELWSARDRARPSSRAPTAYRALAEELAARG